MNHVLESVALADQDAELGRLAQIDLAWTPIPPPLPTARSEAARLVSAIHAKDADADVEAAELVVLAAKAALAAAEDAKAALVAAARAKRDAEGAARSRTMVAMRRENLGRLQVAGARIVHASAPARDLGNQVLEIAGRDNLRVYLDATPSPPTPTA